MTENPAPPRSNWVPVTTAIVGGVLVIGAVGIAALAGLASITRPSNAAAQSITVDTAGVESLRIEVSLANARVDCGADDGLSGALKPGEARLEASTGPQSWRMQVEHGTLRVEPVRGPFGWLGGFRLFGWGAAEGQTVTVTLPPELCEIERAIDAEFELAGGQLRVNGGYAELEAEVSAGELVLEGAARSAEVRVSAGEARLDLIGLQEGDFEVSAGSLTADLRHAKPGHRIGVQVSAGDLELVLPDWLYRVDSSVSAGKLDNRLRSGGDGAENRIDVEASAGSVILRAAD